MNLLESVRLSLGALGANKLRSVLTMLGVIIGVGAVISLMSIGTGVQKQVTDQIKGMGSNLLFITPGAQTQSGVRTQAGAAPTLTDEDAEAIMNSGRVPQALAVAPEAGGGGQVVAGGINTFSRVMGVTPAYESVRNFKVADGEFINEEHNASRSLVAVLGSTTASSLFPGGEAVGQTLRVNQLNL